MNAMRLDVLQHNATTEIIALSPLRNEEANVPVMKREDWLKLSPDEKVLHYARRTIDRIEKAQARYERLRTAGKITEPIAFFEEEATPK